ncbi:suppressor of fused domain protein, partial [Paraburkholderia xenovorans]
MTIIEHLEKFLGPIDQGWSDANTNTAGKQSGLMIARFSNFPSDDASTYATIGLSHTILNLPNKREV